MYIFAKCTTALALLSSMATAAPIPITPSAMDIQARGLFLNLPLHKRLLLFKRGMFGEAVEVSDLGGAVAIGVAVGNLLGGPVKVCENSKFIFNRLAEGESVDGTNTIGDRAVAGMRRMMGTTDASDTMSRILSGDLTPTQIESLRNLVANPDKTVASLKAYKYLLDTQAALQSTVDNVVTIGGSPQVSAEVLDVLLPIMKGMETTIDKIGDDFSVQKFDVADQDSLLKLLEDSASQIATLQEKNISLASSTTAAIVQVQTAFANLAASVREAAAIALLAFPEGETVACA